MAIQAKYTAAKGLQQDDVEGFATATFTTFTDNVTLTSKVKGEAVNGRTFQLVTLDPAANAGEAVLVAFTGTPSAVVCTVTPDDAVLTITTAEFAEMLSLIHI